MASESFVQPAIPRFDGHYDHWSMLMENFLRSKEYWTVVISGVAEPAAGAVQTDAQKTEYEGMKLKDLKAKNYLFQAIDRSILETILCKNTAKHIWDSMKKKYQGTARAKRQQLQALRSEFEMLRMTSGESVTDYFSRTMAIVNKMRIHGDKAEDVTIVEKILRSLTPKFNFVVCSIEEANDIDELSIDELQSSLLVHEQKINQQEKEKSAFLHGDLKEEVFIDQPPGYVKLGNEHKVYKLKKALYGLKQAPRAWYNRIETYFLKEGFQKCPYEHTLFIKIEDGGKMLIVCLYVDDLIYTGNFKAMFESFKKSMMAEFEMSDLGMMHYFLGIEVVQSSAGIFISQKKYVREILDRFQMKDCNPVNTPSEFGLKLNKDNEGKKVDDTLYKQIVGSLMYLTATRPDIMHAVSVISRYMECPTEIHLLAAKRIFRYLQGTKEFGLFYKNGEKSDLFGFTDSDYAGDSDDRKSTSGYVFMMGTGAVSWSSKKQPIVTLSSTEAEFVAATACACQAIWLKKILKELHFKEDGSTQIYCDNSSAIKLSKNPVLHGRSKHIDVKYHFLRDLTNDGVINLIYCRSEDQIADILTKPLKFPAFQKLRKLLGVCISK